MLVGAAREIINPEIGHKLAGYGDKYLTEGVHDDLSASALYLNDGSSEALLLNFDLIGMRGPFIERMRTAVSQKTGLPIDQIFLACTHTHSGPAFWDEKEPATAQYVQKLLKLSASAAGAAKANAEECDLYYNFAFAAENMNRRYNFPDRRTQYTPQNKQLAGTSTEYCDRELGVIAFRKRGTPNKYKSVITIYTSHPLNVGNSSNLTTADYQGYIRKTIEETFAGCTVLSLTGCAGDHHPLMPESGFAQAEKMGRNIGSLAVARCYDSILVEYDTKLRTAWRDISLPTRDQRSTDLLPEASDRKRFAEYLKEHPDHPKERKLKISLLGIGPILIVGTPGEPVAELGAMIKWACPFLKTYPLFQSSDSAGYIPTANQYLWGGYEAVTSPYAQGAGEKMVQEIVTAAYDLVKKSPLNMTVRASEVIGY